MVMVKKSYSSSLSLLKVRKTRTAYSVIILIVITFTIRKLFVLFPVNPWTSCYHLYLPTEQRTEPVSASNIFKIKSSFSESQISNVSSEKPLNTDTKSRDPTIETINITQSNPRAMDIIPVTVPETTDSKIELRSGCNDPKIPSCLKFSADQQPLYPASSPPPLDPEEDDYGNHLGAASFTSQSALSNTREAIRAAYIARLKQARESSIAVHNIDIVDRQIETTTLTRPTVLRFFPLTYPVVPNVIFVNPYETMSPTREWTEWVNRACFNGSKMWLRMEESGLVLRMSSQDRFLGRGQEPAELKFKMFIGIFSSPMHISRRTACRDTWLDHPLIKSGVVAYRFFVGLHRNVSVSESLFKERELHGDIEILRFMDSYYLISHKTAAIADFAAQRMNVTYIMKTDDDVMIRLNLVLQSVENTRRTEGLLYGSLVRRSFAVRNRRSKWYSNYVEWPMRFYPMWAHGAAYIFTIDIARYVSEELRRGTLKFFKLEDVCFGIWVNNLWLKGKDIWYMDDKLMIYDGCRGNYSTAHYQHPDLMYCLSRKIKLGDTTCCGKDEFRT